MRNRLFLVLVWILVAASGAADYKQALPGYHYEFPRDHFNHPDYQTEWWYYTGNLKSKDGHRFGFELTFFRQGIARDANRSTWQVDDIYMAHLALSDLGGRQFHHRERVNRAGPGIAGINENTGLIWNGNWQVQLTEARQALQGVDENFGVELDLTPAKPPVIHGRDGISRKAAGTGHASHYVSLTRLITSGTVELNGESYHVDGTSWMDHEFFSDAMDETESGWDWMSLQFNDGSEVMLYRLRHKDGGVDPFSSGSYIDTQGKCTFLASSEFTMTPQGETWSSPQTKGVYPIRWQVAIPKLGIDVAVSTPLANQEMAATIGPSYWEGAIDIDGKRQGHELRGVGYLEMTGYANGPAGASMGGVRAGGDGRR
jgi:predicted secreted hydrolase